jgi:hypothetical protein
MNERDRDKIQEEAYLRSIELHNTVMAIIGPLEEGFPEIYWIAKQMMDVSEPDIEEIGEFIAVSLRDMIDDIREKPILDNVIAQEEQLEKELREGSDNPVLVAWLARERRRIIILQGYISFQNALIDDLSAEDTLLLALADEPRRARRKS